MIDVYKRQEAAMDLGANPFQTFQKVVLKLSMPGVINGIVMVFLMAISSFVIPKLLGGGQFVLIGNLIESQFVSVGDWNFGSAISLILAVLILVAMRLMKKMDAVSYTHLSKSRFQLYRPNIILWVVLKSICPAGRL